MQAEISQLFIFPVKSLRGIAVDEAKLTPLGLQWDRHWMLIDENNQFISQRKYPSMVLIQTGIDKQCLILRKKGMDDLHIPLNTFNQEISNQKKTFRTSIRASLKTTIKATIWKDQCDVIDEGEAASTWLHEALLMENEKLKGKIRLVRMAPNAQRPQSKPELLGETTTTEFADAAPYLICNQSSLDQLNNQLITINEQAVTMERFRPNIVISGIDAFNEHDIDTLQHADYTLRHCYPCQRCVMTTIDIVRAQRHPQQQPFRLLTKMNTMPDNPKAPAFGENAILLRGENTRIRVGDNLSLARTQQA